MPAPVTEGETDVTTPTESYVPVAEETSVPTVPVNQTGQVQRGQYEQGKEDYRQSEVNGDDARSMDQQASKEHKMCA